MVIPGEEFASMFDCTCLLHGNRPPLGKCLDAAYLPGLASDNYQDAPDGSDHSVLDAAAGLYAARAVLRIVIPGYEGTYPEGGGGPRAPFGYPGSDVLKDVLTRKFDVRPEDILCADGCTDERGRAHTRTEVDGFVRLAKEKNWQHAVVICTPFHLMRVMLSVVRSLQLHRYRMRMDPMSVPCCDWFKEVHHSQGQQKLPRHMHIAEELGRIEEYQSRSDICSFVELRDYLLSRSASVPA